MLKHTRRFLLGAVASLFAFPASSADLSNYAENAALTALLGTGTFHVSLHTGDPGETCTSNELAAANGYARQGSTFTVSGSTADNDSALTFGPATADQGTVTHFAIFDAATAGNCIAKSALTASRAWPSGTLTGASGAFTVSLD